MATSATIVLALLTAAVGHPDGQETGRRLNSVGEQHIWGVEEKCAAHLCDGPPDADVELRLGGLPASTAGEEVHLQWWSARKSPTPYNPLATPVHCSVHHNMLNAYPQYFNPDFNGGNVRVSESGEAVIRIRAPSTYFVWRYIPTPHVHLRLCTGTSGSKDPTITIMMDGPKIWVSAMRPQTSIHVISAHPYAERRAYPPANVRGPEPKAIIVGVVREDTGSTNLPETTTVVPFARHIVPAATTTVPPATTTVPPATTTVRPATSTVPLATTTAPSTTTIAPSTTTEMPAASGERNVMISAARDALDLDALEFSPVYHCLLHQQLFDHFSSGCAGECPASAAVAHGQCVREEILDPVAQLETSWQLSIQCGNPCWHSRKNVTLHNMRLSFAGHLDIPFQEVEISMGFSASTSRRLSGTRTAHLTVKVTSDRITAVEGNALLDSFAVSAASMTSLLGLDVRAVTKGVAPNQQTDFTSMGQNNDPYGPAYTAIEDGPGKVAPPSSVIGFLPTEAIIGIAVGIVVLAVVAGGLLWRRQRQRRAAAQEQQAKTVDEKVAEAEAGSLPEANKTPCV